MNEQLLDCVTLQELSRAYGRSFALHRLSLTLQAGSITTILGDNGAGKSTLLNILATADQPTSGELRFGSASAAEFRRRGRHRIGWVSHQTLLYDELTALENLRFFARMYGLDEVEFRCQSWLDRVALSASADDLVRTFSRGMKQRLTIARALLSNPRLLLLDEPATGLDQRGTDLLCELITDVRRRGRIIVLVTHNLALAEALSDRIVILRRGKITLNRPLDEISELAELYRSHS